MLDLNLLRTQREKIEESQKKRHKSLERIDECVDLDKKWKECNFINKFFFLVISYLDTLRMKVNIVKKEIGEIKKKKKDDPCTEKVNEKVVLEKEIEIVEAQEKKALENLISTYSKIGNIVHESVPVHDNEDFNITETTWGTPDKNFVIPEKGVPGRAHHHEILKWIGGYEPERGNKVSGHKGYFLKGQGMLLNQALQTYGTRFLTSKNYTPVQPPYFMKKEVMAETAQLEDFDDQLYKLILFLIKKSFNKKSRDT